MTTTEIRPTTAHENDSTEAHDVRRDALADRLFGAAIAGAELLAVDLGRRLGLYAVLQGLGAATSRELAGKAGIAPRYAREWLEQQAAAGLLDVAHDDTDPDQRRFVLPGAHAAVLVDEESPAYLLGAAAMLSGMALALPAVTEAYRTGGGVPYAAFGEDVRHGISGLNRPMFTADLAGWIATMPDVEQRLRDGGRVLDAACGVGWSSVALARAYPRVRVHGVDLDAASIEEARANAAAAGVADRMTFEVADVAALGASGTTYDLACVFEALHDMGEPVAALRRLGAVLAPGAPVLVADERVEDTFTAPAGEMERFQYACSVLHCLPATMAESTAVASGTVLRSGTVREWAVSAGLPEMEILPVDNEFWRFYRLSA